MFQIFSLNVAIYYSTVLTLEGHSSRALLCSVFSQIIFLKIWWLLNEIEAFYDLPFPRYDNLDFPWEIIITFYSPSCLGQETAKGPFGLRVEPPPAHLFTTHGVGFTLFFNCWTSSSEAVNINFYRLWFDPTGNRTRVYRFSSRRSTHSTTERLFPLRNFARVPNYKQNFKELVHVCNFQWLFRSKGLSEQSKRSKTEL